MSKLILSSEKTSRKSLSSIYIYIYRNAVTKLFLLAFCFIGVSMLAKGQDYLPVITNERGDTISYQWPIPDSLLCIKDEIIIRFRPEALFLDKLCFTYTLGPPILDGSEQEWYDYQKSQIMAQQFPIDTLIAEPSLREAIRSYGGIYLKRITSANPCADTISITRYGDSIKVENYLWMLLKLNNDTSLINACLDLTINYQNVLEEAEPNFCGHFDAIPIDTYYNGEEGKRQESLYPFLSDVETAWNFQTGSYNIKVGIIDDGIDYTHCDLGKFKGEGQKVVSGWNYTNWSPNFMIGAKHGTPIAGIIGALTNGTAFGCSETGVAGIAGGWQSYNIGCSLYGFKVDVGPEDSITVDKVLGAIRDASSDYTHKYGNGKQDGYGVHIINCSWGYQGTFYYLPNLQRAINYAFEQGVSIIASRGNSNNANAQYPACFDPSWVTSVGGHDRGDPLAEPPDDQPLRDGRTRFGRYMDLLAPSEDDLIYTTAYPGIENGYQNFGYTSAAAAHVSGAIALLRSHFLQNPNPNNPDNVVIEPEDYENMLKAAARDLNYDPENEEIERRTYEGYDNVSGWGQLKVGKIFQMLQEGYIIKHYTIPINTPPLYPNNDYSVEIIKEGKRNDCEPGQYNVRKRAITGTFDLGNNWQTDELNKLYVWGRKGLTNKGGLSSGNPLFLTSFTEVTSGEGGNNLISGIMHTYNNIVTAKTYQYELRDIKTKQRIKDLPSNEDLELYITVFGKPKETSVREDLSKLRQTIEIIPNPAFNSFKIKLSTHNPTNISIIIYDYLGNIVYKEINKYIITETYEKNINTSNFSSGVYILEIMMGAEILREKLIIFK